MYERVLFILVIFLLAYFLKLLKIFKEEDSRVFINYVLYFALPSLILKELNGIKVEDSSGVVLFAWAVIGASLLISYLVGVLMGLRGGSLRAFILVSSFGNTAFMGYPFTFAMFGEEGMAYAVMYDQLGSFLLVITAGLFIATGRFSLKELIMFPPFIALLFAFLLRGVELPPVLNTLLEVSGKSLIPVVLFAIGLKFSFRDLSSEIVRAFASVSVKMLLVPGFALLLIHVLGLEGLAYRVALLESAMPPMVMAGVLAIKYGLDERLAVSSISLGVVLSFISVPLIVSIY